MPTAAAFWTISTLQRLVMRAKPAGRVEAAPGHGADQLVEGVVMRPARRCRLSVVGLTHYPLVTIKDAFGRF
jgi:hypothetical protein